MDAEEMRRHLGGADSTTGRGGPAAGEAQVMSALSLVSTEVGQLQERVKNLAGSLGQVQDKQQAQEKVPGDLAELADTVAELGKTVRAILGQEEEEPPPPPPQPWDWASMSVEEEMEAIATLATWVETVLVRWWPRVISKDGLPPCWMGHPDMRRDLSLVYVSYQQAYEHPQRRTHHEVDFRRALDDMLGDITEAAKAYRCWTADDEKPHITQHRGRPDRKNALQYLRRWAAEQVFQAGEEGDHERADRLTEQFTLSSEEVREQAVRFWQGYAKILMAKGKSEAVKTAAAKKGASLLASYQAADPTDLSQAPALNQVMVLMHKEKDPRFEQVKAVYGALVHKFATIREKHTAMSRPVPDERTQRLMDHLGITKNDVRVVFNMMIK
jgi:hypothetical protein